jgi:hypothetical protein
VAMMDSMVVDRWELKELDVACQHNRSRAHCELMDKVPGQW